MTARQIYEFALIELSQTNTSTLLLEDFNYFLNKSVINYVNKRYNLYDYNQQLSDDLRVLKGVTTLTPVVMSNSVGITSIEKAVYEAILPVDYFHISNCIVEYKVNKPAKCNKLGDIVAYPARRLTSDIYSAVLNDPYQKPEYKRPYYSVVGTGDIVTDTKSVTPVRMEIRYGKDNTTFELTKVHVEYLKTPRVMRLTHAQLNSIEDVSDIMEFPDYVCHEIIKELMALLLENTSNPRLQTNIPVNQTIPSQPPQQPQ